MSPTLGSSEHRIIKLAMKEKYKLSPKQNVLTQHTYLIQLSFTEAFELNQ